MAITRLSGGTTPPNGSDPRTFPAIWNDAVDDIEALELPITADRIADGAVTAPKLAKTAGAVMVFDDATARATAIPTPVEGMVTYLEDVGGAQGLEVFDGAVFTPVAIVPDPPIPPKIVQAVSVTKTDIFSQTVGAGALSATVPSLTATITPSSASSKILVTGAISLTSTTNPNIATQTYVTLFRDATAIGVGTDVGSRQAVTAPGATGFHIQSAALDFLDTPETTSAVSYSIKISHRAGGDEVIAVNRSAGNANNSTDARFSSTITVMEVAG